MANIQTETFDLPVQWASYFINSDPTGLEDDEQSAADAWWDSVFTGQDVSCCDVSEEPWFAWHHDADGFSLAGDVATFTFIINS